MSKRKAPKADNTVSALFLHDVHEQEKVCLLHKKKNLTEKNYSPIRF